MAGEPTRASAAMLLAVGTIPYFFGIIIHAALRYLRAHGTVSSIERHRPAYDRHVFTVVAGHCTPAWGLNSASAAHDLGLFDRLCRWADFLRPGFRPARPQAGSFVRARALLRGKPGLRLVDLD